MSNFDYYCMKKGVVWYQCRQCKYKTRGKPQDCPICHGKPKNEKIPEQATAAEKALDAALERLSGLIDKYKGAD